MPTGEESNNKTNILIQVANVAWQRHNSRFAPFYRKHRTAALALSRVYADWHNKQTSQVIRENEKSKEQQQPIGK